MNGWVDLAIEIVLVALLAFAPFAFGAVEPWAVRIVIWGSAAAALLVAVKMLATRGHTVVWDKSFIPVAFFVAVAVFQLVPFTARVVATLSPGTAGLRSELLGPEGVAGTLSLYPEATRRDLRLVVAAALIYFVVIQTFRRPEQIKRLLVYIGTIGLAAAILAVAQDLTGATQIYWIGPTNRYNSATAGPFVHYSHYGQFANLTAGALLALLLLFVHERSKRPQSSRRGVRAPGSLAGAFWIIGLAVALLILATSVLLSGSRTAMSSMVPAALFVVVCVMRSRGFGGYGWVAAPVLAVLLGLLLAVGSGAALERWGTLRSADTYAVRLKILADMKPMIARFPVLGTGLGTHETVFAMYDRSDRQDTATHAENEYAQVLGEMGAIGLVILLSFVVLTFAGLLRTIFRRRAPMRVAAIGIGAAILATAVHSLADFGQHLPANALMAATLCALAVGIRRLASGRQTSGVEEQSVAATPPSSPRFNSTRFAGCIGSAAVVVTAAGWTAVGAHRAAAAATEDAIATRFQESVVGMADVPGGNSNEDFAEAIAHAEAAANLAPGVVRYRYQLNLLRWESISRVRDPETGDVVLTSASREHAAQIDADLRQARRLCPTYGPLYSLAGQIRLFVLGDMNGGARELRTAFRLSNTDALAMLLCAKLDLDAGDETAAEAKFRRYMALTNDFGRPLELTARWRSGVLTTRLAAGSFDRMWSYAEFIEIQLRDPLRAANVRNSAMTELRSELASPAIPALKLVRYAQAAAKMGDRDTSISAYQRALRQDFSQPDWHLGLARVLVESGRREDAIRSLRSCLLLRPDDAAARRLLDQCEMKARTQPAVAEPTN